MVLVQEEEAGIRVRRGAFGEVLSGRLVSNKVEDLGVGTALVQEAGAVLIRESLPFGPLLTLFLGELNEGNTSGGSESGHLASSFTFAILVSIEPKLLLGINTSGLREEEVSGGDLEILLEDGIEEDGGVVEHVLSDIGGVVDNLDSKLLEIGLRSNTAKEKELWRVDKSGGNDNLLLGKD